VTLAKFHKQKKGLLKICMGVLFVLTAKYYYILNLSAFSASLLAYVMVYN